MALSFSFSLTLSSDAHAEGHGPTFTLATPTLGEGQWSSDTVAMSLKTEEGTRIMFREMLGYGINEDLQATLTFPLGRTGDALSNPPRTRVGAMMGAFGDVEASLAWRLHRVAPDVGTRRESSLLFGASMPTDDKRAGVQVGPALNAAVVTGYASCTIYSWLGGGCQYYFEDGNDRLGDLAYLSAVFGWRLLVFRGDYFKPRLAAFYRGARGARREEPRQRRGRSEQRRREAARRLLGVGALRQVGCRGGRALSSE